MQNTLLFDDSIQISIPNGWIDCSSFRQVPDNQYCWVQADEVPSTTTLELPGAHSKLEEYSLILELVQMNPEWGLVRLFFLISRISIWSN